MAIYQPMRRYINRWDDISIDGLFNWRPHHVLVASTSCPLHLPCVLAFTSTLSSSFFICCWNFTRGEMTLPRRAWSVVSPSVIYWRQGVLRSSHPVGLVWEVTSSSKYRWWPHWEQNCLLLFSLCSDGRHDMCVSVCFGSYAEYFSRLLRMI